MYKTDHFQLNQWEKPDRVLMEDFNADNARLDAALQTLTERPTITKLNTFTVDRPITGAAVFDMDVSGIDWGAWQYIFADFQLQGSGYMLLYPNRDPEAATSRGYVTSNSVNLLGGMLSCDFHSTALTRVEFQIFRLRGRIRCRQCAPISVSLPAPTAFLTMPWRLCICGPVMKVIR